MIDFKNIHVTAYENKFQKNPKTIRLIDWLTTDKYKERIEALRQCTTVERKQEIKSELPCIVPSGICGADKKLAVHNGLLSLDVDGKDNPKFSPHEIKEFIKQIRNVAYCGYSCSGLGVWALIPIQDTLQHEAHFHALKELIKTHGIKIDESCSNPNRLRFASYDPEPYINEDASTFRIVAIETKKQPVRIKNENYATKENPFENFNLDADVCGILTNHGWQEVRRSGDRIYFTRPGKKHGVSGNFNTSLRLFTTWSNSTVFEARKAYNPSQIFALLECNMDWKEAARRLKEMNF